MKMLKSFAPVIFPQANILILGSMPGRKSLEAGEYYAHPQNQFWRILAKLHEEDLPVSYSEKKQFLRRRKIALWDVLSNCERKASADASIKKETVNDIHQLLDEHSSISAVVLNGKAAEKYFLKYFKGTISLPVHYVPSTSPAHAALNFEQKFKRWQAAFISCRHN